MDMLSSDESAGPGDVSDVPICISDASSPPGNPDQVLSDDDLPTAVRAADRQQDVRICDVPPDVQVVDLSQDVRISDAPPAVRVVEQPPDVPSDDSQQTVRVVDVSPEVWMSALPPGIGAVDLTTVVRAVDLPPESARMSPCSPTCLRCRRILRGFRCNRRVLLVRHQ